MHYQGAEGKCYTLVYDRTPMDDKSPHTCTAQLTNLPHTSYNFVVSQGCQHILPVSLCKAKMSAGNMIDPHRSLNIPMKHYVFYAIYFSKLKSPFSSNSEDLSALCLVESVQVYENLDVHVYNDFVIN